MALIVAYTSPLGGVIECKYKNFIDIDCQQTRNI